MQEVIAVVQLSGARVDDLTRNRGQFPDPPSHK